FGKIQPQTGEVAGWEFISTKSDVTPGTDPVKVADSQRNHRRVDARIRGGRNTLYSFTVSPANGAIFMEGVTCNEPSGFVGLVKSCMSWPKTSTISSEMISMNPDRSGPKLFCANRPVAMGVTLLKLKSYQSSLGLAAAALLTAEVIASRGPFTRSATATWGM